MAVNLKPLGDKIIVKRMEAEGKSAGGILLPDSAKEKPKEGEVIVLGEGKLIDDGKRAEFQVKVGDKVLFSSYAGNEITVGVDEYILMSEDDVMAVID